MRKIRFIKPWLIALLLVLCLSSWGCANRHQKQAPEAVAEPATLEEIIKMAQKEGMIASVGMPDSWANWGETWRDIEKLYGIKHTDTDMSSAEEIAKFEAEKNNPTADIGDVGITFAPVAVAKGVTQPYKTSYWDEIPDWAKDKEGHWIVGYQGTMAFLINKKLVDNPPQSFAELLKSDYKVAVGDVMKASQAQHAVLAAAVANGGDEKNIMPGIEYFTKLAQEGQLLKTDLNFTNIEKGEIPIALLWDFNALGYRDQINPEEFTVVIPQDGSITSGYATIINKYAPHPNAAKLAREFILSDKGQINLAKGYARPIREKVELPPEVKARLLPAEQYKKARPIRDFKAWEESSKKLPSLWQEKVLANLR